MKLLYTASTWFVKDINKSCYIREGYGAMWVYKVNVSITNLAYLIKDCTLSQEKLQILEVDTEKYKDTDIEPTTTVILKCSSHESFIYDKVKTKLFIK